MDDSPLRLYTCSRANRRPDHVQCWINATPIFAQRQRRRDFGSTFLVTFQYESPARNGDTEIPAKVSLRKGLSHRGRDVIEDSEVIAAARRGGSDSAAVPGARGGCENL